MKVDLIRVALGSAAKLGLVRIKMDVAPTNLHLLTYHAEGCDSNCAFCPQSRYTTDQLSHPSTPSQRKNKSSAPSKDKVSRVTWPEFAFSNVLTIIKRDYSKFDSSTAGFQRICIQSLNYSGFQQEVSEIITELKKATSLPISISIPIVDKEWIQKFKEIGVERICFAIDTATPVLFNSFKEGCGAIPSENESHAGWDSYIFSLQEAIGIFGRGYVSTHLIVGLGETEFDAVHFLFQTAGLGINTGLFAFFPMNDTKLEAHDRPNLIYYRKMQLVKYLIDSKKITPSDAIFNENKELITINQNLTELKKITDLGSAFQTSGCPGCNRPFYNEKPGEKKLMYNYPRRLTQLEKNEIFTLLSPFMIDSVHK